MIWAFGRIVYGVLLSAVSLCGAPWTVGAGRARQDAFRGYGYAKGGPDGRMVGGLCPDRSLRPCCPCSTMLHVIHVSSCLAGEWFVARLSHLGDFPLLIGGFVQLARQSGRDGLKRNLPKPCPPRTAFGMISAKST